MSDYDPADATPDPCTRDVLWAVWAVTAAFGTYFCMYGFRKPFTAASFSGAEAWGIDFKTVAVSTQVLGYISGSSRAIRSKQENRKIDGPRANLSLGGRDAAVTGLAFFCIAFYGVTLGIAAFVARDLWSGSRFARRNSLTKQVRERSPVELPVADRTLPTNATGVCDTRGSRRPDGIPWWARRGINRYRPFGLHYKLPSEFRRK
jgi:hypothetical protein